ncbi:MAG TPA: alpha-glucan family phosphorylase [Patescibacteria group bacterium]|nr:alpha-glucan family phosphorylase [Patescibacteria group bacterium]
MSSPHTDWFTQLRASQAYSNLTQRPIAYFCAEFALSDQLPTYAGGLGILAGDYILEAAEQKIPVLGVGLYYKEGFFHKELSKEGAIVDVHTAGSPDKSELTSVVNDKGEMVVVTVPIHDHIVAVRAWMWTKGTVRVYLLDTNFEQNEEADRHITDKLYVGEKETRFKQEMVLGIGGLRLLESLGHHPSAYHLNEGHSALLILELIRHEMQEHNVGFIDAKERAKHRLLFTNHTLVAAGNDVFSNDLVALLLGHYADELSVPIQTIVDLGLVQESSVFSMTMLALRTAGKINAVSKLHAEKAKTIWADHPMFPITNGVHIPGWDMVHEVDHIWERHQERKQALLDRIAAETGEHWDTQTLLLGWGRRMVRYKRPLALVERLKRFNDLARNTERPIRLVFAGHSHPSDQDGVGLLEELQYRLSSDLKGLAVYITGYNKELAQLMTSGCDMWINTPVVGFEACGTSGMKAALNGVLPLTTNDGWVHEINLYDIGWVLNDSNVTVDVLEKLEDEILPLYYSRNDKGIPETWVRMMQNSRKLIFDEFSMTRALHTYLEQGFGIAP